MLTQEKLHSQLHYNSETGDFFRAVNSGKAKAGEKTGNLDARGYLRICIFGKKYLAHRLAWLYMYGKWPKYIDHINHKKSDNRIKNLRNVSLSDNQKNRKAQINNKSGCIGVSWHKPSKSWQATINSQGRRFSLGYYHDKNEAIKARKKAENDMGFHKNHGM